MNTCSKCATGKCSDALSNKPSHASKYFIDARLSKIFINHGRNFVELEIFLSVIEEMTETKQGILYGKIKFHVSFSFVGCESTNIKIP